jgi:hypothetical protein
MLVISGHRAYRTPEEKTMKSAVILLASCVATVSLLAATSVLEFPLLPVANAEPTAITKAPNGTLWFTEKMHSGADGRIYFTEQASAGDRLGVVAWWARLAPTHLCLFWSRTRT